MLMMIWSRDVEVSEHEMKMNWVEWINWQSKERWFELLFCYEHSILVHELCYHELLSPRAYHTRHHFSASSEHEIVSTLPPPRKRRSRSGSPSSHFILFSFKLNIKIRIMIPVRYFVEVERIAEVSSKNLARSRSLRPKKKAPLDVIEKSRRKFL